MHNYRLISKKGEGAFSEVLKAQNAATGQFVAIKCMKARFTSTDQVNNLREVQALRRLTGHSNIVKLHEVLFDDSTGRLAIVFQLMDVNLYEYIRARRNPVSEQTARQILFQVLKATEFVHSRGIFHRDQKLENILLSEKSSEDGSGFNQHVKLADFGSCRGVYCQPPLTEYIATRWYRSTEVLLTDGYYGPKMDIFAIGCVWFEVVNGYPLFPGSNEVDQIRKIHNILGTPDESVLAKFRSKSTHMDLNFKPQKGTGIEKLMPNSSVALVEVLQALLTYDPDLRPVARVVLRMPYLAELSAGTQAKDARRAPERVENPGELSARGSRHAPSLSIARSGARERAPELHSGRAQPRAHRSHAASHRHSSIGRASNAPLRGAHLTQQQGAAISHQPSSLLPPIGQRAAARNGAYVPRGSPIPNATLRGKWSTEDRDVGHGRALRLAATQGAGFF